jgi:hypothetical protein
MHRAHAAHPRGLDSLPSLDPIKIRTSSRHCNIHSFVLLKSTVLVHDAC